MRYREWLLSIAVCIVSVELAGPKLPRFLTVSPYTIYEAAIKTVEACGPKVGYPPLGGLVTWPPDKLNNYVTALDADLDDPYRKLSESFR